MKGALTERPFQHYDASSNLTRLLSQRQKKGSKAVMLVPTWSDFITATFFKIEVFQIMLNKDASI